MPSKLRFMGSRPQGRRHVSFFLLTLCNNAMLFLCNNSIHLLPLRLLVALCVIFAQDICWTHEAGNEEEKKLENVS